MKNPRTRTLVPPPGRISIEDLPCPPLYGTQRDRSRYTLGPQIGDVARKLGIEPMPHQQYIWDVAHEIDPATGGFVYSEIIVIGPRQATGKTELDLAIQAWRCTSVDDGLSAWVRRELGVTVRNPGPQNVLYAAQNAEEGRKKWRRVYWPRMEASPYKGQFQAMVQTAREIMTFRNGSTWSPISATAKTSGTGDTVDLAVIDEAWAHKDSAVEVGISPAMMTRFPWAQMVLSSMIPGPSRVEPGGWRYLQQKRVVGRQRVEADVRQGTCIFDWAMSKDDDPANPDTWWKSLPGLGIIVPESAIRAAFERLPNPADFEAEYLGVEAASGTQHRWLVVSEQEWLTQCDPSSEVSGSIALSVEMDEDRRFAWIGLAGRRFNNDWHVAIAEPGFKIAPGPSGVDWVLPRLLELIEEIKPCTVAIDPRRPASSLIVTLKNKGIDVTTPQLNQIAGACGQFVDGLHELDEAGEPTGARLWHIGQRELDKAMSSARKLQVSEGAFVFVRRGASSILCPLHSIALAMYGHDLKATRVIPEPQIFV